MCSLKANQAGCSLVINLPRFKGLLIFRTLRDQSVRRLIIVFAVESSDVSGGLKVSIVPQPIDPGLRL